MGNFKQMTLRFKEKPASTGAMALNYIDEYPQDNESLVLEILKKHFLPYQLDPTLPISREIARSCATSLEAAAQAIREMWHLSLPCQQAVEAINGNGSHVAYNASFTSDSSQIIPTQIIKSSGDDLDDEDIPLMSEAEKANREKRQKRLGL